MKAYAITLTDRTTIKTDAIQYPGRLGPERLFASQDSVIKLAGILDGVDRITALDEITANRVEDRKTVIYKRFIVKIREVDE